ncbi:GDP-mannose 4,6-dehydratase [Cellulomonas citrea]|uniref:GDP-mannose 4,6-dehydratase n=1 Tax=Cellulomonas citrea TaxID=1909423 RepID=UPI0022A7826A|nr:GDP-mannose 4,6-dehydratase [Cellulomonas citrea]
MTPKRALITGITGQDGMYLAELLLAKGYDVHGLVHGEHNPQADLVRRVIPGVRLLTGDLTDLPSLMRALTVSEPHEVYNLGAISFVQFSWENPLITTEVTAVGVLNLLEAIRMHCEGDVRRIRFFQASTSEMFGRVQESPQRETTYLAPRSPYGVAKVFGHQMTVNYRQKHGMHASSGILFNHESPRRGPEFVTRKVTRGVARIHLGLQDSLHLGNLDARRDWGFAGDYVHAMWLMLQQDEPDDYVVATGVSHSIRDLLDVAFARIGVHDWTPYVVEDAEFARTPEKNVLVGDATRAREVLGWEPTIDFAGLVNLMVDHDVAEQQGSAHEPPEGRGRPDPGA